MKPLLSTLFLCLLAQLARAQFGNLSGSTTSAGNAKVITPPTLTYRSGNQNQLNLKFRSDSTYLTPTTSQTITGEIRQLGLDKVVGVVNFMLVDSAKKTMRGDLPYLEPGDYAFGIKIQKAGVANFYSGVAKLSFIRIGSLSSITDVSALSVTLTNSVYQVIAQADNTPSVELAAYYAQQAEQAAIQALGAAGGLPVKYPLVSIGPVGYQINHNKHTRYVNATFLRTDTKQIDSSWRIKIISADTVEVVGVSGETFLGEVGLQFFNPISTN